MNNKKYGKKVIKEDCKYWLRGECLCGITGNDYCLSNCDDYDENGYEYDTYGEDF